MKNTKKIAFCGMIAALSSAIMLASYFPYLTYAIPAMAGIFMMVPLIETGAVWAFATYVVTGAISLIIGEKEATILFVALFGYYPIFKSLIERLNKQFIEWILKLIVFNIAVVIAYYVSNFVLSVSIEDFGILGKYGAPILLAVLNVVFIIYDIGISRVASYYMTQLHDKVKKILK